MTLKELKDQVALRIKEPSTYAGASAALLALADLAKDAQYIASVYKQFGTAMGTAALLTAIAAIIKAEKTKPKPEEIKSDEN
jgi:hypothetical protein